MTLHETKQPKTKTCVLHVHHLKTPARNLEANLEEAIGLALAIDLDIIHTQIIQLHKTTPATLIGKGNVEALAEIITEEEIELVVLDGTLSPGQQRNLEKKWQCKVIDRTSLILEIFGRRAITAEGRLQVELATLSYQRTRLIRTWTHLERQRGGFGFTGGPGETQLELDRRMIDDRIVRIKEQLEKTKKTRGLQRSARQEVPFPLVALVGYTNAGKSTLFNTLTNAGVFAEDLLFATLDPTMRQIKLPSGRTIILSDTVGFISNLPTQLVAAFRATLEEVCAADVILHVQDAAHPLMDEQAQEVEMILKDLDLAEKLQDGSTINVFNKMDLLSSAPGETLHENLPLPPSPSTIMISARTGQRVKELLTLIDQQLNRHFPLVELDLPTHQGEALAWLYRQGVITQREDDGEIIHLVLRMNPQDYLKFKKRFL